MEAFTFISMLIAAELYYSTTFVAHKVEPNPSEIRIRSCFNQDSNSMVTAITKVIQ